MKICAKCGEEKQFDEYNFSKIHKGHIQSYCKSCQADYSKNDYEENCEKYIEKTKKWRESNEDYLITQRLRKKINYLIRNGGKKTDEKLGYSGFELQNYLGQDPMLFGQEWTITFGIPIREFDLSDTDLYKKAAGFDNIRVKIKKKD